MPKGKATSQKIDGCIFSRSIWYIKKERSCFINFIESKSVGAVVLMTHTQSNIVDKIQKVSLFLIGASIKKNVVQAPMEDE